MTLTFKGNLFYIIRGFSRKNIIKENIYCIIITGGTNITTNYVCWRSSRIPSTVFWNFEIGSYGNPGKVSSHRV